MRCGLTWLFVIVTIGLTLLDRPALGQEYDFSWDRATVYAVVTDWFANGDPSNDHTGRTSVRNDTGFSSGPDVGGDLAGLTEKVLSGYFTSLGVDVITISAAYPRRLSASADSDSLSFESFWPFDYTVIEAGLGSRADFEQFVGAAHAKRIRVVMQVELPPSSESSADVLRMDSTDIGTGQEIPAILSTRWTSEKVLAEATSLRQYFSRSGYAKSSGTVSIKWLADWVRDFGLDGFQLVAAGPVNMGDVQILKAEGVSALREWKKAHRGQAIDDLDFWLAADVPADLSEPDVVLNSGIDAVPGKPNGFSEIGMDSTFAVFRNAFAADSDGLRASQIATGSTIGLAVDHFGNAGTMLMLLPGLVQIVYGEETGQVSTGDTGLSNRGPMNWDAADPVTQAHWSKLGTFRKNHPAVAGGTHEKLNDEPYAFYRGMRLGARMDEVIIVVGASGRVRLNVSRVFPDDTVLREAYSGNISIVSFGEVEFNTGDNTVLLLEPLQ